MPLKHHHGGHRGRLRARFSKDPDSLEDHELLELLLFYAIPQKDTNALAHDLLYRFGSLSGLVNASPQQIQEIPGMGEISSQLFPVVLEVIRRYLRQQLPGKKPGVYDPKYVGARYLSKFFGKTEEHVVALALDLNYSVVDEIEIGCGSFVSAQVEPVSLSKFVFQHRPGYIVIAHNHPSGIALPSVADFDATDSLREDILKCGGTLLDHLIFDGRGDFVSMGDSGQLLGKNRYYYEVRQIEGNASGEIRFDIQKKPLKLEIVKKNQTSNEKP